MFSPRGQWERRAGGGPSRFAPIAGALVALLATGCGSGGGGGGGQSAAPALGPPSGTPGPAIVEAATPLPSPFPSDRFTVSDPTSPTGLRLDPRIVPADTQVGRDVRAAIAQRTGFGIFAPITVRLAAPIDLGTITDRSVLVVNAEPGSTRFGERVPLDLGRGSYPTDLAGGRSLYARDPYPQSGDLVFEPQQGPVHWEASSNTLLLRPLVPLEEGSRYVCALTDELRGPQNGLLTPPAGYPRPTGDDAALTAALTALGRDLGAIRYQWSFTTGHPTRELRQIADGLDGRGPFAALAQTVPQGIEPDNLKTPLLDGSPYTLDLGFLGPLITLMGRLAQQASGQSAPASQLFAALTFLDLSSVGYTATGVCRGPSLQTGPRQTFDLDLDQGRVQVQARGTRITFQVFTPRPTAANGFKQPPYPVLLFGHGAERSRLDILGAAGQATRNGWAVVAYDAVEHGPDPSLLGLPSELERALSGDPQQEAAAKQAIQFLGGLLHAPVDPQAGIATELRQALFLGDLRPMFFDGRASDVDGDGTPDNGLLFFTGDLVRTRDNIRQTVVDGMVLARALRALGTDRNQNGRLDPEEGDLNRDGVLDFGGPSSSFAYLGLSQGGIVGGVLTGADPLIQSSVLMVPGGGLVDVVVNSNLHRIVRRVLSPMVGPMLVGEPQPGGKASVRVDGYPGAGSLPVAAGGRIRVGNGRTGQTHETALAADGGFTLGIAADAGDPLRVDALDPAGQIVGTLSFPAPRGGLGLSRSSPALRHTLGISALLLEPADPIAFAPHWHAGQPGGKAVLMQVSLGDRTVPIATGAALARAAGLLSLARSARLAEEGTLRGGLSFHPDVALGVEATAGAGLRLLGVNSHAGPLVPDPPTGTRLAYTLAIQRQAFRFLETGQIDDRDPILQTVLP